MAASGWPFRFGVAMSDTAHAAGVVFIAPDNSVLLLLRSPGEKNYANHWALPGGGGEPSETPMQTALREVGEEIGDGTRHAWVGEPTLLDEVPTPTGLTFSTFVQPARYRFVPELNDEHSGYAWVMADSLPTPMHPQVMRVLGKLFATDLAGDDASGKLNEKERAEAGKNHSEREEMPASAFLEPEQRKYPVKDKQGGDWVYSRDLLLAAAREARMHGHEDLAKRADAIRNREFAQDALAMDRGSVRNFDRDGHLHVEMTPISKAVINPYYGREIPGWETLRLDPDKVYQLYRDPDELAKGAKSFAGKPLLQIHTPVSAEDHPKEVTVGSVGDGVEFTSPYLMAPLHIWDGAAIALIESDDQKELSCGYQYDPDMTPGVVAGKSFDGVMRNIRGNHVALVTEGRAGPDVVVQDSQFNLWRGKFASDIKETTMAKILTRKAAVAQGALMTYLAPKLTQDAKLDLEPILEGITAKNFKAKRADIISGIAKATTGKLAKDAKLDGLDTVLMALDEVNPMETEANSAVPAGKTTKDKKAKDETPKNGLRDFLKGKLSEDDMKACDDMLDDMDEGAMDEDDEEKAKDEDMVDKKAMDAAIHAAQTATAKTVTTEIRANERAIRQAEKDCSVFVGDLAMTFDSAEQVYRHTLEMLGVPEAKTIHASALPTILGMQPKPGAKPVVSDSKFTAPDAGAIARATELAPGLAHIKIGA